MSSRTRANFSAFQVSVNAAVALAKTTPNELSDDGRPMRARARTTKGALYDKELEQENQSQKGGRRATKSKTVPKATISSTMVDIHDTLPIQDSLPEFAPELPDPFSDTPEDTPGEQVSAPLQARENYPMFQSQVVYKLTKSKSNPTNSPTAQSQEQAQQSSRMSTMPTPDSPASMPRTPGFSPQVSTLSMMRSQNGLDTLNATPPVIPSKRQHINDPEVIDLDGIGLPPPTGSSGQTTQSKRPRASDIPQCLQRLLKYAIADYRCVLSTKNPFPDLDDEQTFADAALIRAVKYYKLNIESAEIYDTIIDLMTARDSHLRSELRVKLLPLVANIYGFRSDPSDSAVLANQHNYQRLKNKDSFIFREPDQRRGMYDTPILQAAINIMWFNDAGDEGAKFSTYFNPIPLKTIAFIFTTVEYIIDRWETGVFKNNIPYTAKEYRDIYEKHLLYLEHTRAHSSTSAQKLLRIQRSLYLYACKNAGVKRKQDLPLLDEESIAQFDQESELSASEELDDNVE